MMKAWILVTLLGLAYGLPQIMGLLKPERFGEALKKFPRSDLWGNILMPLGTVWFLWNLKRDTVADFATFKPIMFIGFSIIGFGTCVFVRDFLAVRGLAVVALLVAHVVLMSIQWLDTQWRLIVTAWCYLSIIAAIWITVSPWRLRDYIGWMTATGNRIRTGSMVRLGFGLAVAVIGMTAIRAAELVQP
ncbi:MAG: hypothetical protein H7A46_15055 [Verrucomicrobiales bacterium]|nr:hypothetical protein [Verrucomicrobiales bacterium]